MRCPNTPFATRLSGSAKETQLRIRSIFQWKKERPPVWLFTLIVVATLSCFALVACREQEQPPENQSDAGEVLLDLPSENPAPRQTKELLEQIGKPFSQFADMEIKTIDIPDAAGLCMGEEKSSVSYYFLGTQGMPGLAELTEEYRRRLSCAGIVTTVGELVPEITERMSLDSFCAALEVTDYTYGFEDAPDQGWLRFWWDRYTVWIDTDNPLVEVYDPSTIGIEPDDKVLIKNELIENHNISIQYKFWRGEPVVEAQVINGISPISEANPLSEISLIRRTWLADLPIAELPKEAVQLNGLFSNDLWREVLIPLAYDEEEDVTIYGVVDLPSWPTNDRVVLDLREMEPYGIIIRKGNKTAYHSLYWGLHLWSAVNPELYMGDFDHDGKTEAALQLWTGRGTGCSVYKLYIFELDDLTCSVPDYSALDIGVRYDDASGIATLSSGVCELMVEVPEQYRIFDCVFCGSVVSFSCENGQLYMEAGLDFYDTFAYLATVKAPIIYEDGTYRLGEVVSLTENKY